MERRYEGASDNIIKMVNEIREDDFKSLESANIRIVIDNKKMKSKGGIVLGRMKKANAVEKFLSEDIDGIPVDFVMFLDGMAVKYIDDIDLKRLISHELQHCDYNPEKNDPFSVRKHEVEDFYDEIEKNRDDPRWAERVSVIVESGYEKEKEKEK